VNTKTLAVAAVCIVVLAAAGLYFFTKPKDLTPNISPAIQEKKKVEPSETFIEYTDPSGFTFSYPDNLSLSNAASDDSADLIDPDIYAELQLFSKDVSGSLNIKISDTKFKTLDEWLKEKNIPESNIPTEKKLGNLKALEVKTSDRLMLASLDQGVLFTVELPLIEQEFWNKVYDKVVSEFSFSSPQAASGTSIGTAAVSPDEIVFEGEEVVE
jgi:hypothetical protein